MRSIAINKSGRTPLRAALLAGATVLAVAAGSGVAQADLIFSLSQHNSGLNGASGPFGTVKLTDETGTSGNYVHVTEAISNTNTASSGAASGQFEFNLSGFSLSSLTLTNVKFTNTAQTVSPPTGGGSLVASTSPHNGTVGTFDYAITCAACGTGSSSPQYNTLNFDLAATGGLSATDFGQNGKFIYFLADIYNAPTTSTGYVWTTKSVPTTSIGAPEPGSLALLGTGLIGLGLVMRRRRRG